MSCQPTCPDLGLSNFQFSFFEGDTHVESYTHILEALEKSTAERLELQEIEHPKNRVDVCVACLVLVAFLCLCRLVCVELYCYLFLVVPIVVGVMLLFCVPPIVVEPGKLRVGLCGLLAGLWVYGYMHFLFLQLVDK